MAVAQTLGRCAAHRALVPNPDFLFASPLSSKGLAPGGTALSSSSSCPHCLAQMLTHSRWPVTIGREINEDVNQCTSVFLVPNTEPGTVGVKYLLKGKKKSTFSLSSIPFQQEGADTEFSRCPCPLARAGCGASVSSELRCVPAGSGGVQLIRLVSANRESGQTREEIVRGERRGGRAPAICWRR